ncbi:MAG: PilZ domain-containing protein [Nitrospiraceae bacterium]
MDLRRHQRVPVSFTSYLSSNSLGDDVGVALDLSPRGCKMQSDMRVVPSMHIVVHFDVPGQDSIIAVKEAGVRWVNGRLFGLEFIDPEPNIVQRLVQVIRNVKPTQGVRQVHR